VYDPVESEEAHARITAHKDREIRLTDIVLTVSELARKSYVEAGVPEKKVVTVPMGVDRSRFAPPSGTKSSARSEPFTFLLVGHADKRKGADILLKASRRLYTDGVNHRVQVAGRVDEDIFSGGASTIELLGYLNEERLEKAYKQADVLVLPSRFDSFGRVVVEAMATGLPALVSEHVGAKQGLTEGENGWIVPAENVDALAEQMRWCVEHPEQVAAMQNRAADAAQAYTWTAYRERVTEVLGSVVESDR
jgi:glycosyltransferase involved in cell wall biosynthesis